MKKVFEGSFDDLWSVRRRKDLLAGVADEFRQAPVRITIEVVCDDEVSERG